MHQLRRSLDKYGHLFFEYPSAVGFRGSGWLMSGFHVPRSRVKGVEEISPTDQGRTKKHS